MAEIKITPDNPFVQSLLIGDISGFEKLIGSVPNAVSI